MNPMRFTVITTLLHNVGDDFVRDGILHLLDSAALLGGAEYIHKHSPITTAFGLEWIRSRRISALLEPVTRLVGIPDRIEAADALVQSGAPVYWCHQGGPHCADNEWFDPLIRKRFLPNRRNRKFLNIAGGSCQRYHSDGSELTLCRRCTAYIRELFDACNLTLLRDHLARSMLIRSGRDAQVLPCTSIFARDHHQLSPQPGEFIVLNGMDRAGHFTFGQVIDGNQWKARFREIALAAKAYGRVVVACHNRAEELFAKTVVPDLERFSVPNDAIELMKFYSRARFGIVNRVHAGFMIASFGKPVAVIGNDSRARMIESLKLSSYFVGEFSTNDVDALLEAVSSRQLTYQDEIEEIRTSSRDEYLRAISTALLQ